MLAHCERAFRYSDRCTCSKYKTDVREGNEGGKKIKEKKRKTVD